MNKNSIVTPNMTGKLNDILHDFNDEAWLSFHGGSINDQDDFYDYLHQWINDKVEIEDAHLLLRYNEEYAFYDHEIFGQPANTKQAAFCVIYDYLLGSHETVAWDEMQEVLDEVNKEDKNMNEMQLWQYSQLEQRKDGVIKETISGIESYVKEWIVNTITWQLDGVTDAENYEGDEFDQLVNDIYIKLLKELSDA